MCKGIKIILDTESLRFPFFLRKLLEDVPQPNKGINQERHHIEGPGSHAGASSAVSRGQAAGCPRGVWDALRQRPPTSLEITRKAKHLRRASSQLQEERVISCVTHG